MTSADPEQIDDVNSIIKERGRAVVDRFRAAITLNVTDTKLLSALEYITGYWSDYFRPALSSFSCEAVGGNPNDAFFSGIMTSFVDAGVSVHDDILDRTTIKRFRKTVLGAFGLDCALLVGDLLIVRGWSMIGELMKANKDPLLTAKLTQAFTNSMTEMCEGQFGELACRKRLDYDPSLFMDVLCKSNAGIKSCMEMGALLGRGTEREIVALRDAGKNMALLFALKDEVRDTLNVDGYLLHRLKFESVPLPILLAAKSSGEKCNQLEAIISKSDYSVSDVDAIIGYCIDANSFVTIYETACHAATEAKSQLNTLYSSPARDILYKIVEAGVREFKKFT